MGNRQIMNLPTRLDVSCDIWISGLFVPLAFAYAHLLAFLEFFPVSMASPPSHPKRVTRAVGRFSTA